MVERFLPGFGSRVLDRVVMTPADLESRFGLPEGATSQGEMLLDQILFMRPVPGWSRYAMPIPGLFLCGSATHPGGGVTGMSGWLAAQAVLTARAGD
jgi:phytoene dehydrogenase-like protein